jgi:uncharacterized lipoprotein YddW (UPF0748 family)
VRSDNAKIKSKVNIMGTKTITIHVSPEAACVYETATVEQQRKLDALLSLKLTEVARTKRPLEEIMSEISRKAQERGLTPEILESILNE